MNIFWRISLQFYRIYNSLKLKCRKNITIGAKPLLYGPFHIRQGPGSVIKIGNHFIMKSGKCLNPLSRNIKTAIVMQSGSTLEIGNNVGISGSCIWVFESIKLGNNVLIGGDSILMDSNAHSLNYHDRQEEKVDQKNRADAPIVIEDDVLIGSRCIILKGVTVGARSVIAAGSVVTKSIPPDSIAGGNPCKIIKKNND